MYGVLQKLIGVTRLRKRTPYEITRRREFLQVFRPHSAFHSISDMEW